jgi:hypothetical protein
VVPPAEHPPSACSFGEDSTDGICAIGELAFPDPEGPPVVPDPISDVTISGFTVKGSRAWESYSSVLGIQSSLTTAQTTTGNTASPCLSRPEARSSPTQPAGRRKPESMWVTRRTRTCSSPETSRSTTSCSGSSCAIQRTDTSSGPARRRSNSYHRGRQRRRRHHGEERASSSHTDASSRPGHTGQDARRRRDRSDTCTPHVTSPAVTASSRHTGSGLDHVSRAYADPALASHRQPDATGISDLVRLP